MAEQRTPWLGLLTQFADNDAGSITAEDLRDFVQSARPYVTNAPPAATNDETQGYDRGHGWLDITEPAVYECIDPTATAAVWIKVWPQGATGGAWGDITGDLADQTDLQGALDAKANAGDLGTAAAADVSDFATAAQGALADTAIQPGGELTSLAATGITSGYVPKSDGSGGIAWAAESGGGGGASAFTDLTDTPSSYSGQAGKVVTVKGDATGLEFVTPSAGSGDLVVVQHGSNASETRPIGAPVVYWQGSVAPTNRQLGDLWLETGAFD